MPYSRCLPALLMGVFAMASPLSAQIPFFGFQAGASLPFTQLRDDLGSKPAFQGTAFLFLDRYDGHVFKPRADYVRFREPDFMKDTLGTGHPLKVELASLGVDYNYYFTEKGGEGFYVLAGAQAVQARTRWESPAGPLDKKKVGVSVAAGFGIILMPHLGVEARFSGGSPFARFTNSGDSYDNSANLATVSLVLLF